MQGSDRIKEVICIRCPMGCVVAVECDGSGGARYAQGASCVRGREYAVAEATAPERMMATVIDVPGCPEPLSVKTQQPIPKHLVQDAVCAAKQAAVVPPVRMGQVIVADVCGTGVPIVATKSLDQSSASSRAFADATTNEK